MTTHTLPYHIAIIMDGNGRWAKRQGEKRLFGHRAGAKTVKAITTHARKRGLQALTLYAFSEQNWDRPKTEVAGLMELLGEYIVSERSEILDNNIRFTVIGRTSRLSSPLQEAIAELKEASCENTGMEFCIALSYGGREELLDAFSQFAKELLNRQVELRELTEEAITRRLYTAHLPPLDLIIRTSGELRLSNFLLWQAAYAELYFTPVPWPEFTPALFDEAIEALKKRQRRFGKTQEQLP